MRCYRRVWLIKDFSENEFRASFRINGTVFRLINKDSDDRIAQILAHFLRGSLIESKKKFSFETVFSHPSKLEIMRKAVVEGYKVYLYFISTESPEINTYRVSLREKKGGHDVPEEKIRSRYVRSLELMFDAAQIAYQVFFFDNSGEEPKLFAHFKLTKTGKKKWDKIKKAEVPQWFKKYYSEKAGQRRNAPL